MAIDKELYERYKQMKAQGQNITLAELKAQQERSAAIISANEEPTQTVTSWNNTFTSAVQNQLQETPKILTSTITYQSPIQEPEQPIQDNGPKKFALIGYPLGHSLSEYIHNAGFKSLGINAKYDILETNFLKGVWKSHQSVLYLIHMK